MHLLLSKVGTATPNMQMLAVLLGGALILLMCWVFEDEPDIPEDESKML